VTRKRPALFRGRHFEDVIILLCVRWYLRYSLSYRDLKEIVAERNLSVDHVTIWRWVQRYAPVLNQLLRREMRHPNRSWRVDETYVKVAGNSAYLYRAVDSAGETIEFMLSPNRDLTAARLFLRLALSGGAPSPRVINVDGHPAYASAIAELKQSGGFCCKRGCGGFGRVYRDPKTASALSQATLRRCDHPAVRPVVPAILPQLSRSERDHGGTEPLR
jgi:IS6 family transposase